MQELLTFFTRSAGLVALVCAVAGAYYLANAYRARKDGRSAMFDAERQVATDRAMRNGLAGLVLMGLTLLFFGIALLGASSAPTSESPTRTPTRAPTTRPGISPTGIGTPTRVVTSTGPTSAPPPTVTPTRPAVSATTPPSGRKTAVVTGTSDVGGLKFRKTPSPTGEEIDRLPDGTVLEMLGQNQTAAGLEWVKVRDSKNREGWVASQYLILNP